MFESSEPRTGQRPTELPRLRNPSLASGICVRSHHWPSLPEQAEVSISNLEIKAFAQERMQCLVEPGASLLLCRRFGSETSGFSRGRRRPGAVGYCRCLAWVG